MDWLLSPATPAGVRALRTEITAFLRRHAADPDQVWAAELTVSELITNAFTHAGGPIWVGLDWTDSQPRLTVHDLGPDFTWQPGPPATTSDRGRGLWLVSQVATQLAVAAKRGGGKRVSALLPVPRRAERSLDPPYRTLNPLPALSEAGSAGFTREPFLRALLVELTRAVQHDLGPAAAERLIASVGATVGAQMEREFRRAREVVGRLSPQRVAECYVRLKAAIDGDFYPIEIGEERIVLGNRRCPFGEAVRAAPGLCRMTSSVFGGIAARNTGGAVVQLDERIAVGDPECRVTILLGPHTEHTPGHGHRYQDQEALD